MDKKQNNPNTLFLDEVNVLFFNIFIKNNKLYLITPLYKTINIEINKICISCENAEIGLDEIITKDQYEATQILIYNFPFNNKKKYKINVQYGILEKDFILEHIKTFKNKKLSLTTLFKTDYKLITMFYDYYKEQGVEHFYMYYNGSVNSNIKRYCNKKDITLIEWDFIYWNKNTKHSAHYAQLGQMHDALYRFGKDDSEYMIFCDLDEYMSLSKKQLIDLVQDTSVDTYGFCNIWADTFDGKIPEKFPDKFKIEELAPFRIRSKCIHKIDTTIHIGIHFGTKTSNENVVLKNNNIMYHFKTWSGQRL